MSESKMNKGVIFKNLSKKTEKHPDYTGSLNVDGKEVKFSGWSNTSTKGLKYISLSVNTFKPENQDVYKESSNQESSNIDEDVF